MADYYAGGSDIRRQFEGAVPILIIILLIAGVIALKPSILAGLPVVGDMVGSQTVDILLIGEDTSEKEAWESHLTTEIARKVFGNPLNVELKTENEYDSIRSKGWIEDKGYDVVLVTATDLTSSLQMTLRNWVEDGGKMIVIGIGGTQEDGRWSELKPTLPVECGTGDCQGVVEKVYAPSLHVEDGQYEHQLAEKINTDSELTSSNGSINVADVSIKNAETQIMYLDGFETAEEVEAGKTGNVYPAFAEKGAMNTGKVIYMSFNPTKENINTEENIVLNTLAYAAGAEGTEG